MNKYKIRVISGTGQVEEFEVVAESMETDSETGLIEFKDDDDDTVFMTNYKFIVAVLREKKDV